MPTAFEKARGGALGHWEREAAGSRSGSPGAVSPESAAGFHGRLRGSSRGRACAFVGRDGCEVRLCDPCVRVSHVSRVSPGSPSDFLPVFLRAGAGRRSGSGWRQDRVRWGRPLLSRPRGALDSGPAAVLAAVESVAVSAVAWSCGCVVGFGWMVVRFVRVIRVPACARVSRACVPAFYRSRTDPTELSTVLLYR